MQGVQPTGAKVGWVVIILLLPLLSLIAWLIFGPRSASA
ncbi:MAG TPA: PLDc N-terminal domain-containing protein [Gammaproteobacteria bacterium]|nr:PLDc N-terminal domain-containing protein [Gammaproteobacteria bacterium]